VTVQPHDGAPVAAVQLWLGVGARHEAPAEAGFAHFVEHLLFKGTATRGPGAIDEAIAAVGGEMNAATSQDFTYYHAVVPAAHAGLALDVLADAARHAALVPEEVERERQVVLEEIRRAADDPASSLWHLLARARFGSHPYGRPVLGTEESIGGGARDAVAGFLRRHYRPGRAAVVVAGAVDAEATVAGVAERFADWAAGPPAPAGGEGDGPGRPGPARAREVRDLRQTYLGFAWPGPRLPEGPGPPPAGADVYAAEVLVAALGRGRASRLHQALRERLGLVASIGASFYLQETAGTVLVTARTAGGSPSDVEAALREEIERVRREPLAPDELARARTSVEAGLVFGQETAEGLAYAYGLAETLWSLEFELGYLERVRAVGPDEVLAVAQAYLDPAEVAAAVLGPTADG
jgi:zinc protease